MRVIWSSAGGSFWPVPLFMGILLILTGILIIRFPQLLAYAVAGLFLFAGVSLIGFGFNLRRAGRYTQRVVEDEEWVVEPQDRLP